MKIGNIDFLYFNDKETFRQYGFCLGFQPIFVLNMFLGKRTLSIQWKRLNSIFLG
jgi:hypothetical protein